MTSDNVFSDWLTSLVTFFDKMLYIHLARRNALIIDFGIGCYLDLST